MDETIRLWLADLINGAIEDAKGTIGNERIWENGCQDDYNPHAENIAKNEEYIEILEGIKSDFGIE